LTQDRPIANDVRIVAMLAAVGTFLDQRAQVTEARRCSPELLDRGERLGHRDDVGRFALARQLDDVRVDEAVRFAVEVRVDDDIGNLVDRPRVEEKAPEQPIALPPASAEAA